MTRGVTVVLKGLCMRIEPLQRAELEAQDKAQDADDLLRVDIMMRRAELGTQLVEGSARRVHIGGRGRRSRQS